MDNMTQGLIIFGPGSDLEQYDEYNIVYANKPLPKYSRQQLKSLGWILARHTRSNKEIWIFNKKSPEV